MVFHGSELLQPQTLAEVETALDHHQPAAVIVELPSNPLLRCMDLPGVSALARNRGIPVIADDTIGTGINLNALPYADLIFTSLTKSFAGRGDVMAGSVLVSPQSPWAASLLKAVPSVTPLSDADAIALEIASRDVLLFMSSTNRSTLSAVAKALLTCTVYQCMSLLVVFKDVALGIGYIYCIGIQFEWVYSYIHGCCINTI